jgi:methylthioribose-1-phosphate isomerase
MIARGVVHAVVVGADRIAANGDVANKVGTYGLALAAHAHDVPFYVVAPWSTIDRATPSGAAIAIEDRDEAEVLYVAGTRVAPEGAAARNPAFDVTPAALVTALVTERGVLRAPYEPAISGVASEPAVAR